MHGSSRLIMFWGMYRNLLWTEWKNGTQNKKSWVETKARKSNLMHVMLCLTNTPFVLVSFVFPLPCHNHVTPIIADTLLYEQKVKVFPSRQTQLGWKKLKWQIRARKLQAAPGNPWFNCWQFILLDLRM